MKKVPIGFDGNKYFYFCPLYLELIEFKTYSEARRWLMDHGMDVLRVDKKQPNSFDLPVEPVKKPCCQSKYKVE